MILSQEIDWIEWFFLLNDINNCFSDEKTESKKAAFKAKAGEYMERAEKLKLYVAQQKENAKKHTQV